MKVIITYEDVKSVRLNRVYIENVQTMTIFPKQAILRVVTEDKGIVNIGYDENAVIDLKE